MKVEKLVQSKRESDRWYAEMENGDTLRLNLDHIAAFGLFTGRDLSEEEYAALSAKCETSRVRARALRILGSRMLSRRELTERLAQKGEAPDEAEKAADWLEDLGILDDGAYASAIVRHYAAKGYGALRVQQELYRRGIAEQLRRKAMGEMPDPGEAAVAIVRRELARRGGDGETPDRDTLRRLSALLARRGFTGAEARRALARYAEEAEAGYED